MVRNTQPVAQTVDQKRLEALGPAERIVQALTTFTDHGVHNRPGVVVPDGRANIGVRWEPVTWKKEGDNKVVYRLSKVGRKSVKTRLGILSEDNKIMDGNREVGEYRLPGLYPEAVTWMYQQVADVYKMDNEFAARWASWAFARDHRDLKVVLAAFMLVQKRSGEAVKDAEGKLAFFDEDYRDVGEAMCLLRLPKGDFNPKLLLRVGAVLAVPGIAKINQELGFGQSDRHAFLGRYTKAVEKWLCNRETNPKMLEALVTAGFRTDIMSLARRTGYKPISEAFFDMLRWKQKQAKDGRRTMAIKKKVRKAESWKGLSEQDICQRITDAKPKMGYKRIVGMIPATLKAGDEVPDHGYRGGLTAAIMAAAIEAGSVSDADLIILTPTLEQLGLLTDKDVGARWKKATETAENQRAVNVARRVRKQETVDLLQGAADKATTKALEEVTRGMRVYTCVDVSGSMNVSIERAKEFLCKFLGGFPADRIHVSVFNSYGRVVQIKQASAAGVEQAFRGISASGGTAYSEGIRALATFKPKADEDSLILFVGDEGDNWPDRLVTAIKETGFNPLALALLKVPGEDYQIVQKAAVLLNLPCLMIDPEMFNDPYSVTRTLRNLIATTPVRQGVQAARPTYQRKTLVQEILETPLLTRPVWA